MRTSKLIGIAATAISLCLATVIGIWAGHQLETRIAPPLPPAQGPKDPAVPQAGESAAEYLGRSRRLAGETDAE